MTYTIVNIKGHFNYIHNNLRSPIRVSVILTYSPTVSDRNENIDLLCDKFYNTSVRFYIRITPVTYMTQNILDLVIFMNRL